MPGETGPYHPPAPSDNGGFEVREYKWQWLPFPGWYQSGYVSVTMETETEARNWGNALKASGAIQNFVVWWLDPDPEIDNPQKPETN